MQNVKQITNHDLSETATVTKTFYDEGSQTVIIDYPYKVITSSMLGSINVVKFGYCINNNQGKKYPIYLTLNGIEDIQFYIGKTGMFEFQPEEWVDVNADNEERTATVYLSKVLVPADIPFCIDYCYSV